MKDNNATPKETKSFSKLNILLTVATAILLFLLGTNVISTEGVLIKVLTGVMVLLIFLTA